MLERQHGSDDIIMFFHSLDTTPTTAVGGEVRRWNKILPLPTNSPPTANS